MVIWGSSWVSVTVGSAVVLLGTGVVALPEGLAAGLVGRGLGVLARALSVADLARPAKAIEPATPATAMPRVTSLIRWTPVSRTLMAVSLTFDH